MSETVARLLARHPRQRPAPLCNPGLGYLVVPAKAETHNHRRSLLRRQPTPSPNRQAAAYGSLLFAGTTQNNSDRSPQTTAYRPKSRSTSQPSNPAAASGRADGLGGAELRV